MPAIRRTAAAAWIAAGLAAASGAPAPAAAEELSLAHFMPPMHTMHREVFVPLQEQVAAATDGALTIEIFPAGELGAGPSQQFARAVDGIADVTFGLPGYTSSIFPRTLMIELPGLFDGSEPAMDWIWDNIELFRPDFERVELLGLWTNTNAVIITADTPIDSMDDLAGLNIRAPSAIGAAILEAWGATAVTLPASELYNALQTGVVDGVMIGPDGIRSFRLNEVGRHVTTGLPSGLTTFYLVANRDAWAGLPDDQRAEVEALVGRPISTTAADAYRAAGRSALDMVAADEGTEIVALPADEVARFRDAAAGVIDDYVARITAEGVDVAPILGALEAR